MRLDLGCRKNNGEQAVALPPINLTIHEVHMPGYQNSFAY